MLRCLPLSLCMSPGYPRLWVSAGSDPSFLVLPLTLAVDAGLCPCCLHLSLHHLRSWQMGGSSPSSQPHLDVAFVLGASHASQRCAVLFFPEFSIQEKKATETQVTMIVQGPSQPVPRMPFQSSMFYKRAQEGLEGNESKVLSAPSLLCSLPSTLSSGFQLWR